MRCSNGFVFGRTAGIVWCLFPGFNNVVVEQHGVPRLHLVDFVVQKNYKQFGRAMNL